MLRPRTHKDLGVSPNPTRYALCLLLAACTQAPPPAEESPARRLQQAGQPLDPVRTAGRIATMRVAAATGNAPLAQQQMGALQEDVRRSMKLPDPARRIDPEAARAAVRTVAGVRSVVWVDRENLLALVTRNDRRTHRTIDEICSRLEPLGDTLGVVVNLQSAAARNGDELEILSRNCQLAPGDRAMLQAERQVDVLSPDVRAQYRDGKAALEKQRKSRHTKGDRAALEAIPEI